MTYAIAAHAALPSDNSSETAENDNQTSYSGIYFDNICRIAALTRRDYLKTA